jgi:hypothetical protein
MKRLIHHDDDIQAISGHIHTITWAIQCFTVRFFRCPCCGWINFDLQVESTLAIEFALDVRKILHRGITLFIHISPGACPQDPREH